MSIEIRPLTAEFVAEVDGVDIARPLDAGVAELIEAGMDRYAVLIFHDQDITDDQQRAFSLNFGALEIPSAVSNITKPEDRRLGTQMTDISNLDRDGQLHLRDGRQRMFNLGNRLWHSDSSFRAVPSKFSLLSARVVPSSGGETQFADMRAGYDALDEQTQAKLQGLVCEHSLVYSRGKLGFDMLSDAERARFKPVRQSLLRVHPATGRKSLYLSAHAGTILGWQTPEARIFLQDLNEIATQPRFVHSHHWRQHDLVIWDNRQTMHRGRAYDDLNETRDMRRTTVAGTAQTADQAA
ncbi:MAG: TauD/TfdA family dioxygenase [Gammaproteobacteria bacterium]|nr:TauD/TfdA family dioxygenase [Gammaproteobacteria bacterium]